MAYKNIKITKGNAGFGGPLIIEPNEHKNKVLCVTGQQVSPVAKKIAEMTGCELVDGFKTTVPDDEVAVAVVSALPERSDCFALSFSSFTNFCTICR